MSIPPSNEPDACPDDVWQQYWVVYSPTWADWMYYRFPPWVRQLDDLGSNQLYRFCRILGRALNQTQDDINHFTDLWNIDACPTQYLDSFAATLGFLLPHAVEEVAQRRLLETAFLVYERKGSKHTLEFIASRYLGVPITISDEDFMNHTYDVTIQISTLPAAQQSTYTDELTRILALYEPAGLIPNIIII